MSPSTEPTEPKCRHIVFEALFLEALKNDPAMHEGLRTAGFDAKAPAPEYGLSVFGACLEVAMRHHFPGVEKPEVYSKLGNKFVEGIMSTMLGKIVGTALLVSGPDRTVKRVPTLVKSDYGVTCVTNTLGARHYEVVSSSPNLPAWVGPFLAGVFEEALRRARSTPSVSHRVGAEPGSFVLDVTWPG